jgi:hypothetical protein
VCYHEQSVTYNPGTGQVIDSHGRSGCALHGSTLNVRKLNSITLRPTVIELTAFDCDAAECTESPGGSITVSGRWTGVGPTMSQRSKSRFDDGSCIQVSADESTFRDATFVGSFEALGAQISKGSSTFKTNCPF